MSRMQPSEIIVAALARYEPPWTRRLSETIDAASVSETEEPQADMPLIYRRPEAKVEAQPFSERVFTETEMCLRVAMASGFGFLLGAGFGVGFLVILLQ